MHSVPLIAMLVAGFALAFVFGALAHRLRLSPIVGYLLAGVVIGPYTPGFIADPTLAPQLAEIGVILLMFGVGLHFSLRDLLEVRRIAIPGALAQVTFVTALGWALGRFGFGWDHGAAVVFGLALSIASTVVVLRALEERRLLDTQRGRIAVGWLIVEDLVMVLALVLLPALADAFKTGTADAGDIGRAMAQTVFKVGGFIAFMLVVGRRVIPWLLERIAALGSRELFTLCVLAIALGVAFGSATLFGVSFALGAFFAGLMLAESEFSQRAANETLPFRDAFAVLFFVSVGMLFDPAILVQRPLEILATFAVIVGGNTLAAWGTARVLGENQQTSALLGVSLSQIGEFSFILASLGVSLALLPEAGRDLILAGALLSIVANPFLLSWMDRRASRRARRDAPVPGDVPVPQLAEHVVVVGYGRVGAELARLLHARGVPLVVVDGEDARVDRARADGLACVRGNAVNEQVLREAQVERAVMAVLAIPDALEAGEIVAVLRMLAPGLSIVARGHTDAQLRHLLDHGADAAVMAERELAHSLSEMVLAQPRWRGDRPLPSA